YAKLWLKEMSTSMDHDWQDIILELHPNEDQLIPNIRVTLGGVRKTMQPKAFQYLRNVVHLSQSLIQHWLKQALLTTGSNPFHLIVAMFGRMLTAGDRLFITKIT
ncbi:MAG: hypothetical protein VXY53_07785, partial [Candidatus Thermoplasmatota archaeon]|nr:hypothetical protein [Candidatus Thermoplasmatota archaeon]